MEKAYKKSLKKAYLTQVKHDIERQEVEDDLIEKKNYLNQVDQYKRGGAMPIDETGRNYGYRDINSNVKSGGFTSASKLMNVQTTMTRPELGNVPTEQMGGQYEFAPPPVSFEEITGRQPQIIAPQAISTEGTKNRKAEKELEKNAERYTKKASEHLAKLEEYKTKSQDLAIQYSQAKISGDRFTTEKLKKELDKINQKVNVENTVADYYNKLLGKTVKEKTEKEIKPETEEQAIARQIAETKQDIINGIELTPQRQRIKENFIDKTKEDKNTGILGGTEEEDWKKYINIAEKINAAKTPEEKKEIRDSYSLIFPQLENKFIKQGKAKNIKQQQWDVKGKGIPFFRDVKEIAPSEKTIITLNQNQPNVSNNQNTSEQESLIQENMKAYNRSREEVIQALKNKGLL